MQWILWNCIIVNFLVFFYLEAMELIAYCGETKFINHV